MDVDLRVRPGLVLRTALLMVVGAALLASASPRTASAHSTVALSLGSGHTCALSETGAVQCWGWNSFGQLGDGTRTDRYSPVDVAGLGSGVAAISAGYRHTCAVTTTGAVKCWGDNSSGQLGDGTTTWRSAPVDVVGLPGDVVAIAAGHFSTCALTETGGVWCWGSNGEGQLGDGTTTNRPTPVGVAGLGSEVAGIAARGEHACAVLTTGAVKCWGDNAQGQLGDGTTMNRTTPEYVLGLPDGAAAVAIGEEHTCVRTRTNGAKCWGAGGSGQLGDGARLNRTAPVDVWGLTSGVASVVAGDRHTCAVVVAGGPRLKCWGSNDQGQLGDGSTTRRNTATDVVGLGTAGIAVSAGRFHTCAFTTAGRVACWGQNDDGELGDGTTRNRSVPAPVPTIGAKPALPMGDVTCDGNINSIDAALELQVAAGLLVVLPCEGAADLDGSGSVNAIDALIILQIEAGLLPIPP